MKVLTPIKAIRAYCIECSGGMTKDVKLCTVGKEEILAVVESGALEPKYVKALLRENDPLEGVIRGGLKKM